MIEKLQDRNKEGLCAICAKELPKEHIEKSFQKKKLKICSYHDKTGDK